MKTSFKSVLLVFCAAIAVSAIPVTDVANKGNDGIPDSVHEQNGEVYDSSTRQWLVKQYGQCGGKYYQGSYVCTSGFACHYSNDAYSQCY